MIRNLERAFRAAFGHRRRQEEHARRAVPGLPVDGRPLDRYEAEKLLDAIDALRNGQDALRGTSA